MNCSVFSAVNSRNSVIFELTLFRLRSQKYLFQSYLMRCKSIVWKGFESTSMIFGMDLFIAVLSPMRYILIASNPYFMYMY